MYGSMYGPMYGSMYGPMYGPMNGPMHGPMNGPMNGVRIGRASLAPGVASYVSFTECALFHKDSKTLLVTDAVVYVSAGSIFHVDVHSHHRN